MNINPIFIIVIILTILSQFKNAISNTLGPGRNNIGIVNLMVIGPCIIVITQE